MCLKYGTFKPKLSRLYSHTPVPFPIFFVGLLYITRLHVFDAPHHDTLCRYEKTNEQKEP